MENTDRQTVFVRVANHSVFPAHVFSDFLPTLDEQDRIRCERLLTEKRKRQFLAGRILLKQAVGDMLQIPAKEVRVITKEGIPSATTCQSGISPATIPAVSLSHSGSWIACAVSSAYVGIDIEIPDPARDVLEMARQAFLPDERAWLAAQPEMAQKHAFYHLWTAKEAQYKLHCAKQGRPQPSRFWEERVLMDTDKRLHTTYLPEYDLILSVCGEKAIDPVLHNTPCPGSKVFNLLNQVRHSRKSAKAALQNSSQKMLAAHVAQAFVSSLPLAGARNFLTDNSNSLNWLI
ncbi:MAG: 4'-phosphopantetheinyl transferase superfamily protein [Methylobacillus sp.]|nr:4'-phosphopantetheinyl transferase superfamily protein [Methylobacillus sp.]